ncbi:uncharacterized protein sS8_1792 [Methylocaldum marinum]|uniref:Glutamyl-tRNA synthetase n=1 Tax=Methylocaldum marinum TaxID=1432792 RepID=A0A250KQ64_9GAMM|nr:DUF4202 domain-containing protein [Methylocaldum marinum]BBA33748.1 uncharacterized protein sS8_1792 [Methylocaldum marinum]
MNDDRLEQVLGLIDEANAQDPNREVWQGESYSKELLYGTRMTEWLDRLYPGSPDLLHIAARGQHIRRWEVPRQSYPDTREGYLQWRSYLYGFHADRVAELMTQAGYGSTDIERVRKILQKRGLKSDPDVQSIEDVACLVFLDFYFAPFAVIHNQEKLIGIVRKTWKKMSEHARNRALELEFPDEIQSLLAIALQAS